MKHTPQERKTINQVIFKDLFKVFLKQSDYNRDFFADASSNFLLILLFSLIEGVMQEGKFMDCIPFLESKNARLKRGEIICNENLLDDMIQEYRDSHGAIKKVKSFFSNYIMEKE